MKTTTVERINDLLGKVGKPLAVYERRLVAGQVARFEVYLAKWFGSFWKNSFRKELVEICRESFLKYGPLYQLEASDEMAAVLLVRAAIPLNNSDSETIDEWFSFRYRTGDEDLSMFVSRGNVQNGAGFPYDPRQIISLSRFCAARAYHARDGQALSFVESKHRSTVSECVVLMMKEFIKQLGETTCEYVSFIIKESLRDRIAITAEDGSVVRMPCDPDSDRWVVNPLSLSLFEFPHYWFERGPIGELLTSLVLHGELSYPTLYYYLAEPDGTLSLEQLAHLGRMLDFDGKLEFSTIDSNQLRRLFLEKIPIQARLHVLKIEDWVRGFDAMFRAGNFILVGSNTP